MLDCDHSVNVNNLEFAPMMNVSYQRWEKWHKLNFSMQKIQNVFLF